MWKNCHIFINFWIALKNEISFLKLIYYDLILSELNETYFKHMLHSVLGNLTAILNIYEILIFLFSFTGRLFIRGVPIYDVRLVK